MPWFLLDSKPGKMWSLPHILPLEPQTTQYCSIPENTCFKYFSQYQKLGLPRRLSVKNPPAVQETWIRSLGREDPLEKRRATHSSVLAWEIIWTEEPDRRKSMGSQKVGHNLATKSNQSSKLLEKE